MLMIISALLDLWDPYELYLFPKDEYAGYAKKIQRYLVLHEDTDIETLANFVFAMIPPLTMYDEVKHNDSLSKIEYERFAKAVLLVLNERKHICLQCKEPLESCKCKK